jgi:predicted XRE-type DNA-binding protein
MKTFDNGFELLTDNVEEVKKYKIRSDMMNTINDFIKSKGWSHKESPKHLGVSRRCIIDLENGRISKFSNENLTTMFNKINTKHIKWSDVVTPYKEEDWGLHI